MFPRVVSQPYTALQCHPGAPPQPPEVALEDTAQAPASSPLALLLSKQDQPLGGGPAVSQLGGVAPLPAKGPRTGRDGPATTRT